MDPKIEARKAREQSAATLEGITACQEQVADLTELVVKLTEKVDALAAQVSGKRA